MTVLRGHSQHVYPVAFTPDGASLLSGGWDGRLVAWDTETGRSRGLVTFAHPDQTVVTAVAPAPDGTRAFVGVSSGTAGSLIFAIDPRTGAGQPLASGPEPLSSKALAHDPGRPHLAALWSSYENGTTVEVHDTGSGEVLRTFEPRRTGNVNPLAREFTSALAYSPDGRHLALALGDDRLLLVDAASLETRRSIDLGDHRLSALAFSPDSRHLAAGRDDLALVVLRVEDGSPVASMTGHTASIFSVAWSPDGSRLASGADDRTVRLWDTTAWEPMVELRGHGSYVYSAAFSPDGRLLASGSGDGSVRLWDTRPADERRQARWGGSRSSPGAVPPWETRISLPSPALP